MLHSKGERLLSPHSSHLMYVASDGGHEHFGLLVDVDAHEWSGSSRSLGVSVPHSRSRPVETGVICPASWSKRVGAESADGGIVSSSTSSSSRWMLYRSSPEKPARQFNLHAPVSLPISDPDFPLGLNLDEQNRRVLREVGGDEDAMACITKGHGMPRARWWRCRIENRT